MTPQERDLITELFDRLSSLESAQRDPQAEGAIADGLSRAPHAVYALVQTVLVQDEALKRADARIRELEGSDGSDAAPREGGSFLDNMRGALFGRDTDQRGSVPPVRTGPWGDSMQPQPYGSTPPYGSAPPYAPAPAGGSFLGTAAAAAAGMIGGGLMLDGIRSMFGHGHPYAGAFAPASSGHSPWENSAGSAANSDLARGAGIDDIGGNRGHDGDQHAASLFGSDDADDADSSDVDSDFDVGDFDGGSDAA
jgi:uncharacterized protein